ncbi:DUF7118 family protein [Natronococcus occultus]|uniref:Uncharacterized protein n=1 Tax=Natronococcus occultus SP4 TaxID=694430 RepID=L0K675_9EURY|nr:hypothetical protein [Natronococcus occultus]AGB39633.1 hypothetical protein Natoc_3935 [Natronococcus occultus SP4]
MSESVSRSDDPETERTPLEGLEDARDRYARAISEIEERGPETVEETTTAYHEATDLLDRYVDRATGTGRENFKAYVELEGKFDSLVDGLSDGLEAREAFEGALEALDKRRLSESDFERARERLAPAREYADLLEEREAAREAVAEARKAASRRLRAIDDELDERKRLLELAEADLDAPVERLREPIARYDELVRTAFREYRDEASAREVFALLDRSRWYPFVPFERPPEDLKRFVRERPAGEYTIPELLEYADYSRSKLAHYVEDADELKRTVATQQTSLEGIDAEPLTIGWPPGPAGVLERRSRELRPFVDRVADEETVAALREVRLLARDEAYDRLQTAAQAVEQLTAEERERLRDGQVAAELEALRAERERLEDALEDDDPV